MALSDFYEDLIIMDKRTVDDGMGGYEITLVEGATFQGAVTTSNSFQKLIAEQQGVKSTYRITTSRKNVLPYGTIVKRPFNGQYYRVTSNSKEKETPKISNMDFSQVTAELFDVTNNI